MLSDMATAVGFTVVIIVAAVGIIAAGAAGGTVAAGCAGISVITQVVSSERFCGAPHYRRRR